MPATGDKVMNRTDASSGLRRKFVWDAERLEEAFGVLSGGCCGFEYSQENSPKKWAFKQRFIIVINIVTES